MATTLPAGAEMPMRSQSVRTRRPPTSSRAEPLPRSESSTRAEASRLQRRSSQRSTTTVTAAAAAAPSPRHPQQPDMLPPATNNNAGPAEDSRDGAGSGARTSKHRYRTVIPAPSGNYAFIKTIGQGSMGKVKLAKKEGTNELASLSRSAQPIFLLHCGFA